MADPRYSSRKLGKVVFAPAVAALATPTRAEITAGTVLVAPSRMKTVAITGDGWAGWESSTAFIDTPDGDTKFVTKIPGEVTVGDMTMTFYDTTDDDVAEQVIQEALAEMALGVLINMYQGDVEDRRCQCWPVQVASQNPNIKYGNEANTFTVAFAPTAEPVKTGIVPAAAP